MRWERLENIQLFIFFHLKESLRGKTPAHWHIDSFVLCCSSVTPMMSISCRRGLLTLCGHKLNLPSLTWKQLLPWSCSPPHVDISSLFIYTFHVVSWEMRRTRIMNIMFVHREHKLWCCSLAACGIAALQNMCRILHHFPLKPSTLQTKET